jgi:hypothetical protein
MMDTEGGGDVVSLLLVLTDLEQDVVVAGQSTLSVGPFCQKSLTILWKVLQSHFWLKH